MKEKMVIDKSFQKARGISKIRHGIDSKIKIQGKRKYRRKFAESLRRGLDMIIFPRRVTGAEIA